MKPKLAKKVSNGFHSRHFYSATIAVTAFRALVIYPWKIASPRIRTRVGGFLASVLGTLTSRPPRLFTVIMYSQCDFDPMHWNNRKALTYSAFKTVHDELSKLKNSRLQSTLTFASVPYRFLYKKSCKSNTHWGKYPPEYRLFRKVKGNISAGCRSRHF